LPRVPEKENAYATMKRGFAGHIIKSIGEIHSLRERFCMEK